MSKRPTLEDRRKIDELDEQGYKPYEIAHQMDRDTRTVKHYLSERVRERSVELERQQQELDHRNDIHNRIENLKERLKFPSPAGLDITDLSAGSKAYDIGHIIRWQQSDDGSCIVKLDDEFCPVVEHLRSSRRKKILDMIEEWRRIGGKCIVDCHRLRLDIKKEAERQSRSATIVDIGYRGLLEGFSRTVYYWALCSATQEKYKVVSQHEGLYLLKCGMYNLAWVRDNEVKSIEYLHRRLIEYYRRVSTTVDILKTKELLRRLSGALYQRLDEFASMSKLPGKCCLCPGE